MPELESLSEEDLMRSIVAKKKEMFRIASLRGIRNVETVKYSRELDALIIHYQKRFKHKYI